MTVRVAIGNFMLELENDDFRKELGEIGPGYLKRLREIVKIMHPPRL
jgi:hypothetical protein